MAELRDDILREEEQFGGFNPGEPDDDAFSLGDKPYPGNIDFYLKPLKNLPTTEDSAYSEINDSMSNEDEISQSGEDFENVNSSEDINEDDLFEFEKKKLQSKKLQGGEDLNDDSDLAGYVQGIMAATKRKHKPVDETSPADSSDSPFDDSEFVPVENDAETQVVISDMDLDKPSTAAIGDMNFSPAQPPLPKIDDKSDNYKDSEGKTDKDKEEKEKRKLGILPIVGIAAALLLIVAAGLLYFLPEKPFGIFSSDKTHTDSLMILTSADSVNIAGTGTENDKENEKQDTDNSGIVKSDTLDLSKEKDIASETSKDLKKSENNEKIEFAESKLESKAEITKPVVNKEFAKDAVKPDANKEFNKNAVKPVVQKNIQKDLATNQEKKIVESAKKPEVKKSTGQIEKPKTPKQIAKENDLIADAKPKEAQQIIKETAINETFVPKDEPGVYTVQIYSSPSKEDAETWLNKLRSKNVQGAFISEQNVRDKVWYRVRFGNFRTREEARNAALRLGFAQTWIDRVK
ncbi:MAG: SPOR domain-containing protein [Candidatus Kapabacteria bacterium]|nr:SPOR domain-containing protein [Ignavibacteriota bacterium]MCW5884378.1 SPOR domain-containing protein [Candidatus Kapabacteria bacterium]